ncbi:hypothetical protein RhiJN_27553 [Ceratobasidium sp. AG-Ba]|nr:hypothetical protein RhiJN_27553 [Ceratobasidium sp. AG-Ba]
MPHSTAQTPPAHHPAPAHTHPARPAPSAPTRTGNLPSEFELYAQPISNRRTAGGVHHLPRPPTRPPELKRPPPTPTALVTPPTPVAPNGWEQAQSRMDIDARPPAGPVSPMLKPRPASPSVHLRPQLAVGRTFLGALPENARLRRRHIVGAGGLRRLAGKRLERIVSSTFRRALDAPLYQLSFHPTVYRFSLWAPV